MISGQILSGVTFSHFLEKDQAEDTPPLPPSKGPTRTHRLGRDMGFFVLPYTEVLVLRENVILTVCLLTKIGVALLHNVQIFLGSNSHVASDEQSVRGSMRLPSLVGITSCEPAARWARACEPCCLWARACEPLVRHSTATATRPGPYMTLTAHMYGITASVDLIHKARFLRIMSLMRYPSNPNSNKIK